MRGDESYGRNYGYYCLLDAFRDIFERGSNQRRLFHTITMGSADVSFYREEVLQPHQGGFANGGVHQLERSNFFIVPQGRCAESLLFSSLGDAIAKTSPDPKPPIIISNGFFDTTAANAKMAGFELQVFTNPALQAPFPPELIGKRNEFKGNLDIPAAEAFLENNQVTMILLTITNNWAAGQPVSMANIREAARLAKKHDVPLFFDACRFAENAFFIQKFEDGFSEHSIPEIIQEIFGYADGFTISLKKDGLANMGGVLCFHDDRLFARRYQGIGLSMKERQLICYGNDAYGGSMCLLLRPRPLLCPSTCANTDLEVSGRDLMAATAGLYETTKASFLATRVYQVQSFAQKLLANGVPVLSPPGGHAVFLDMKEFFTGCDRDPELFSSVGFTIELIKDYGIRAIESGPFAWEFDKKTPEERAKIPDLVRFAVPRNVLSDEHIDYAVAAIKALHKRRHTIPNVVITRGKETRLRHFQVGMKPVPVSKAINKSYVAEAERQLSNLSLAVDQSQDLREKLLSALRLGVGKWGQGMIPQTLDRSGWLSDVSNDHSPIEYSLNLDQQTGDAEVRFLLEAQAKEPDLSLFQASAKALNEEIIANYKQVVSFDGFDRIQDVFMPEGAEGRMAAWHSFAASKSLEKWKLYLNPLVSGRDKASSVTSEAFARLGLGRSWELVQNIMGKDDYVVYFALGCSIDESESEVKAYVAHPHISAAEIAQKHTQICPDASAYEIQQFLSIMAGGSHGPYTRKPLISCFAFKRRSPETPVRTVLFPLDSYAASDEDAQEHVERYMEAIHAPGIYRERYRKVIESVQRRPLAEGRGIHSWVSLKHKPGGKASNAYYLSPEYYGALEQMKTPLTNGFKSS